MGVSYLAVSAVSTAFSFVGLQYQAGFALDKLRVDRLVGENFVSLENANNALGQLLDSYATAGLLANFLFNVFILINLCLKSIFFVDLYPSETRKLAERLVNYVIYKGTFLPLVIPPTVFQVGLWLVWLTIMCSLKMFQALARDRLERLNASPSALPSTYFRVYSALLFVLSVDLFCIAFETMQAMLVHGFQLLDIWHHHSAGDSANCQRFKFFDSLRAGSLWEWKGTLTRNVGFALDMATLLMALGHYALLSAIIKRVKGFIKLRMALGALHAALPDATSDELRAYDDECAICREPMARAKRLHCSHLFHLPCLRSWLDQGLNDMYSCPTCRKPLFLGRTENETSPRSREVLSDEQLARQISERDQQTNPGNNFPVGAFPNQAQNPTEGSSWRSTGLDPSWLPPWPNQGLDGAGPSNAIRSVGLGRVQMMMRHIASVGETYAQTALEDAAWSLWPMNPSQATTSSSSTVPPPTVGRYPAGTGGLQIRTPTRLVNDNMANLLAMANTVHEVLPHIPDELILEDLQRTNSVAVTVNNLLQM
ncbi:E3 ubiquitin protein ligase RIN2 [Linum perenne]